VTVLLRNSDWTCEQAAGGREALEKLATGRYDCVLLDISMPDMSGEEVCKQIRANAALKDLHVVAYTAHTMKEDQQKILAAGFDALLIKPINRDNLLETLNFTRPGPS
jgi:CheY-like chemotaxis protein